MLLFDVPAGVLVSRFGNKPVILGGLLTISLTGGTLGLSDNLWLLIPIALLYGAGLYA